MNGYQQIKISAIIIVCIGRYILNAISCATHIHYITFKIVYIMKIYVNICKYIHINIQKYAIVTIHIYGCWLLSSYVALDYITKKA